MPGCDPVLAQQLRGEIEIERRGLAVADAPAALKPQPTGLGGPFGFDDTSITRAASMVAATAVLPVEVLMKSAPASIAAADTAAMISGRIRQPLSMMTLSSTRSPQAALHCATRSGPRRVSPFSQAL